MKTKLIKYIIAVVLIAKGVLALHATLYHEIEFENATLSSYRGADAAGDNGYWILTDQGTQYKIATKNDVGIGLVHQPVITGTTSYTGQKSLYMQIDGRSDSKTPGQKSLIDVCNGDMDPTAPYFGDTRAVRFAIMLPEDFQVNTSELMLCEWWRNDADVTLILIPGTTQWQLTITNSAGTVLRYNGSTLTKGQWHTIALEVTPNYLSNGQVQVWQDGASVLNITNTTVGKDPAGNGRKYAIDVGLYRPGNQEVAKAYFDQIRYGDKYSDVSGNILPPDRPRGIDMALNCPVVASSQENATTYIADGAVDGDDFSRWSSDNTSTQQWINVDMGASHIFNQARISWFGSANRPYQIQVSDDAQAWSPIYSTANGSGGINDLVGLQGQGRYVRLDGLVQTNAYRLSVISFEIYNGLEVISGSQNITLMWQDAARAKTYNVKRSTNPGGPYTLIATGVSETSYTDLGLNSGVPYYYVVSSVNEAGESEDSAETIGTPN